MTKIPPLAERAAGTLCPKGSGVRSACRFSRYLLSDMGEEAARRVVRDRGRPRPRLQLYQATDLAGTASARSLRLTLGFVRFRAVGLGRLGGLLAILAVESDAALLQRRLQSAHQVDHVAAMRLRRGLGDLLAGHFLLGCRDYPFAIIVLVLR